MFEWKNVSQAAIHHVYSDFKLNAVNSPEVWIRGVNRYCNAAFSRGGYPTFEIGENHEIGVYVFGTGSWENFSEQELSSVESDFRIGQTNSAIAIARAGSRVARNNGLLGVLPTMEIGPNREHGFYLISHNGWAQTSFKEGKLQQCEHQFVPGTLNSFDVWSRACNRAANREGGAAFPSFEIEADGARPALITGVH